MTIFKTVLLISSEASGVAFRREMDLQIEPKRNLWIHLEEPDKNMTTVVVDRVHLATYIPNRILCCCSLELPGGGDLDGARVILPFGQIPTDMVDSFSKNPLWERVEGEDEKFFTLPRTTLRALPKK